MTNGDLKSWILSALFAVLLALFGFALNAQAQRMQQLDQFTLGNRERIVAVEQQLNALRTQLDRIEQTQAETNRLLLQLMKGK